MDQAALLTPALRRCPVRSPGGQWQWLAAALIALLAVPAAGQTSRTVGAFDVTFYNSGQSDDGVTGAYDWTPQQMDDIAAALISWGNGIANTPGRQVKLHVFWNGLGSGVLAQATNQRGGNGTTSWTNAERVWRDGVNVVDGSTYDARIQFGTGVTWNFGAAAATTGYDFRSVSGHELGHTLGFVSTYTFGPDTFSSDGLSAWDKKLVDSFGNTPAVNSTGTPGDFNQLGNPVYFTGVNARAANGNNDVPVYAPISYVSGSSMSHVDETALPNALMSPQFGAAQAIRAPTALEWEIMKDLGWTVIGTKTWSKGAGTLNWTDAANWSSSGVPDGGWNAKFTGTGLADGDTLLLSGSQALHTLSIDSTKTFTVGGSGSL